MDPTKEELQITVIKLKEDQAVRLVKEQNLLQKTAQEYKQNEQNIKVRLFF
jgi:hypothetical protein